ncbi:MAG: type B DNA-directed DNA polymerase, partial [Thermoprotei archaeon]
SVLEALGKVKNPEEFEKVKALIREIVRESYNRLRNRELTLDELAFKVFLSKNIEEYVKTVPQHVRAAKMLKEVGLDVRKGDIVMFVKVRSKYGVKPVQLAKISEIDVNKYVESIESTFEQLLDALNIEFKEIMGISKLEAFF